MQINHPDVPVIRTTAAWNNALHGQRKMSRKNMIEAAFSSLGLTFIEPSDIVRKAQELRLSDLCREYIPKDLEVLVSNMPTIESVKKKLDAGMIIVPGPPVWATHDMIRNFLGFKGEKSCGVDFRGVVSPQEWMNVKIFDFSGDRSGILYKSDLNMAQIEWALFVVSVFCQ